MDKNLHAVLMAADDAIGMECPAGGLIGTDGRDMLASIQRLHRSLRAELRQELRLDEMQDATSFADIMWLVDELGEHGEVISYKVRLGVRFSNFGRLYTLWTSEPDQVSRSLDARVRPIVEADGWRYVPADQLRVPYDGSNQKLRDGKFTWWERYFDYL